MCNHISFIGKKFIASIGEPWDFVSSYGKNSISGIIISEKMVNDNCIFLSKISPFLYNDKIVKTVLLSYRYTISKTGNLLNEDFNFSFMKDGSDISFDIYNNTFYYDKVSWLIGGIIKVY